MVFILNGMFICFGINKEENSATSNDYQLMLDSVLLKPLSLIYYRLQYIDITSSQCRAILSIACLFISSPQLVVSLIKHHL